MTILRNLLGNTLNTVTNLLDGTTTVPVLPLNPATSQVRLTFTSAEVGNGDSRDSDTLANQDGGLAVRMQAENSAGGLTGPVARFSDEGIRFVSLNPNVTFDVRDLVSGVERGDGFQVVELGTRRNDHLEADIDNRSYYINAGMGDDTVTGGKKDDFLVGGAGNDKLSGGKGNDSFIGGSGNDVIFGGEGNDLAIFNIATDGSDMVDLGTGNDVMNVTAPGQVRVTFTSAEVGNGNAKDAGTLANQDGGLAVRLQAEDAMGGLTGLVTRVDDEGISFVAASPAVRFDVRDLVSGVGRGEGFEVVQLGTSAADMIDHSAQTRSYYVNAGMGDDVVTGSKANDFLVGGAGNDVLTGGLGNDSFIGGGGNDVIFGGDGDDTAIYNITTDGADATDLGAGLDVVSVAGAAGGQVRVTFTSAEVGNGNAKDAGTLANQDGGLAVRLQAEDGTGTPAGVISRFDDEGITFVSATAGLRFDVRDLVSGVGRGEMFEVVQLGTSASDAIDQSAQTRSYYVNAGMGDDTVTGGAANDFLVGGAGNDVLDGRGGNDSLLGGGGADTFVFSGMPGNDTVVDFVSGTDKLDFSALGLDASDGTVAFVGANTLIKVDADNDGVAEFTVTLLNTTNIVFEDFIFA